MWSSLAVADRARRHHARLCLGRTRSAAIVVSVVICIAGWRLGRRTIDTLTDTAPAGVRRQDHRRRDAHSQRGRDRTAARAARSVKCCSSISSLRSAARCRSTAWRRSRTASSKPCAPKGPAAEVTVTTEPRALDDETVLERVMVIARNRALAVHHVTVHAIEGRLAISLDLEVDGSLSLGAAHDIASGLEDAIREELGPDVEVDTHIEPLQPYDEPRPRGAARADRGSAAMRCPRSPPGTSSFEPSTTCGCARPTAARSSISTAWSTRC